MENPWQKKPRQREKCRAKVLLNFSFFFFFVIMCECLSGLFNERLSIFYRPPVRGWTCLQDRSRAASSSWSPAAKAVTRTSSSAELMASDKCVMGELSGPEVHRSCFYEKRQCVYWSVFCKEGISYSCFRKIIGVRSVDVFILIKVFFGSPNTCSVHRKWQITKSNRTLCTTNSSSPFYLVFELFIKAWWRKHFMTSRQQSPFKKTLFITTALRHRSVKLPLKL